VTTRTPQARRTGTILVTGATGFLGRHVMPVLVARYGAERVVGVSRRDYDLMDPAAVQRMFDERRPERLVHLAAYSGGIGANKQYPADFFHQNILLTALVFHAAADRRVDRLLYPMGGCSYPATARSPIVEAEMWNGYPQAESAGYSMAKKMGLVASASYRQQYGLNSVVIVPGNMYGEYDNFRPLESHVIPALIRRILEATRAGAREVAVWGTGRPERDFVYAGDVAALIPHVLDRDDVGGPINISSGTRVSIRSLVETIADLMAYDGALVWDTSKPDGQLVKIFDVTEMQRLGLTCPTPLRDGLRRTIAWFAHHYDGRTDGIRL
jgi:GDP-L-fucose synthase